ncbi:MAG: exodeoxyribonuclease VII large subunit [Sideroxydans sp.]|nr:exodeoxyribonuclease VII large subunit [Sideroxydans sp.]
MFPSDSVLSVRELNLATKRLIESGLPLVWVRGEISNFVAASSGHWYFSLKDEQAQVRCVMFRHKQQYLDFRPSNGMLVEVHALATLYEARGEFQLTLERMRPAGQGALYEAFERLKGKLSEEGLFDPARKRELPEFPRQIGIITSPQAAALRDALRTLSNRMPSVPVVLYPTPVQGEGAARKIAQAIHTANERAECDVLIVCRGGGSIEDLWSFNEEVVARAIAASEIPVISGVGHETDFTIADFVADLRAATPTAAAQAAVPDRQALLHYLAKQGQQLTQGLMRQIERRMQQLDYLQRRLVHPAQRLQQQTDLLAALRRRIDLSQGSSMQQRTWQLQALMQRLGVLAPDVEVSRNLLSSHKQRLAAGMARQLERHEDRLLALQQHLHLLDPNQVLARGYSLVRNAQGDIVTDSQRIASGEVLDVRFAHGGARVQVQETLEPKAV